VSDLYERWLLGLWGGDLAVAEEIVADDFVGHWPEQEVEGRDALVEIVRGTRDMFATLGLRLELGPFTDGDHVIARWTGTGRTPDGGEMRFLGNDILRVRDGRIVEYWVASWAGEA
jgi:ketosteroid isomerase-like protein